MTASLSPASPGDDRCRRGGVDRGAAGSTTLLAAALLALVVLPLCLRPATGGPRGDASIVVITPHNEAIRIEFAAAFARWSARELGRTVVIDWRNPGGASDIARYIDSQYQISPAGIGIDVAFGGGQFEFAQWASKDFLVDAGIRERHPEWFAADGIPAQLGGETIVDAQGRYYGACLASFGICFNPARLAETGMPEPRDWADLAAPGYRGRLALADPTRSGSVNRCFELMLQQAIARAVSAAGHEEPVVLDQGWQDGFLLIKRLVGNARAIADAATRITQSVARGDAAAGICIDFYGRAQEEWTSGRDPGTARLRYITPAGGTSISADPIALMRGAPQPELAQSFMDFVLSPEGQQLWNDRPGLPGGPERYALRRWPVQPCFYREPERRARMRDPDEDPYALGRAFHYQAQWTGRYFSLIRTLIDVVALDAEQELRTAWTAICTAGGPDAVPEAMKALAWLPFRHQEAAAVAQELKDLSKNPVARARLLRQWTASAVAAYADATRLAQQGR